MVAFPLSVLALAAGVYLLIKVKREYIGGVIGVLAWLVVAASLVSLGYTGYKAFARCGSKCGGGKCTVEKEVVVTTDGGCHKKETSCSGTKGCHMEGDSCVMDKEKCEAIMGKEACEAMIAERGRCIMSKEECAEKCGKKCCSTGGKAGCKKSSSGCPHASACQGDCGGKCGGECKKSCSADKKKCCKKDS
ncbi:MAG: hypothetical protein KIS94_13445 [Chitinophagales bacterium]|nr:hypothetical protein [Chitinophagales bacterium]